MQMGPRSLRLFTFLAVHEEFLNHKEAENLSSSECFNSRTDNLEENVKFSA